MSSEARPAIGRYEIRRELGRGMMGVVYEAHDPVLGREIALKVIQLAFNPSEEDRQGFEQRFFAEARTAARLSHPGIVVVHDVGRDERSGTLFMALELLRGETLDHVLKQRGPLDWREALHIAQQVAQALHHAHASGVVHRDVKPANVMLLPSGEPKIMDFGIAKIEAAHLTASGQFLGTPLYMSPEQALAHPVDGRSDLFSLGSVLYEMLTGRQPFAGESVTKILFQIMSREPEELSLVRPGIPDAVDYLLARCLAKDLSRRYPDGRALAEDIDDVLAGRAPRGQASWQAPIQGSGTLIAPAPSTPGAGAPLSPRARPRPGDTDGARPPKASGLGVRALAGLLLAAAAAGAFLLLRPEPVARRVAPADQAQPSETTPATAPAPPQERGEGPARLIVDFEHSLKSGTLRVWVDDDRVVEETIGGRVTRDIAGLKFRKGRLSDTLEVIPGRRLVRVQVAWDDNVKSESLYATFKPGETSRLRARLGSLGGLKKDLSLDWY
ncbi:MAG: serine/threonine-protein kinase [Vicinamibacteria bacterium]